MTLSSSDARRLRQVLVDMSNSGIGEAGSDVAALRRFLPLPEHARIFEPETFLIIGQRGAGKTELFRAISTAEGRTAIAAATTRVGAELLSNTTFIIGYQSSGTEFPAELLFRQFAEGKSPIQLQMAWLGLLIRSLRKAHQISDSDLSESIKECITELSPELEKLASDINGSLHATISLLDQLDSTLANRNQYLYIAYDDLDRLSASDWEQLATILRGLIQFWSSHARRWRRIRPKIFLRRDLYERTALMGPDVSKISAQRLSLSWLPRDLYALMVKRFVNQDQELVTSYLGPTMPPGTEHPHLGWTPYSRDLNLFKPVIDRICGELMGASTSKGRTFSWIVTHLQDSHAQVLPRSFVKIFEKAAELENNNPRAVWPRLIHHSALRGALDLVSLDRMEEFKEEIPWIENVRRHFVKHPITLPVERRQIVEQLNAIDWTGLHEKPAQSRGYDILQFLGELGIFYEREGKDERVDVRDLYLDGFGFKRKGGVKKPF